MGDLAVFGGSFDPPHIAHIEIVRSAIKNLDISKLLLIPTYLNPFKESFLFSPQQRFDWLVRIFRDESLVEVLDYEIQNNKPTPTIDTINFIEQKYNPQKIYLLLGDDNLETLEKWHRYESLKEKVEFVIIPRNKNVLNYKSLPFMRINISSAQIKEALKAKDREILKYLPKEILSDIERLYE